MNEEYIDVQLDEETINMLNRLTKKEMIEKFSLAAIEVEVYKLRCQTALEDVERLTKENNNLKSKLEKAEFYVEQGRSMIDAVMDHWDSYD